MSEKNSYLAQMPDAQFYRQLVQNFLALSVVAIGLLAAHRNPAGVWSFAVGAVLSAVNFWLLSISIPKLVRADLAAAPSSRTGHIVRRAIFEFVLRYIVVGVVAFVAIRYDAVHVLAFTVGLSLPIFAIMIQGIRMTVSTLRVKSV